MRRSLTSIRHQRSTPFTSLNRGMSLEAIAALLGHASLSMTMTYARIADRTVAEEYFAVTEHLDAIYTPKPAATQTTPTEGPNMRRLRKESTRLLGKTYTHFSTNDSHRQTITDQAANAAARGEPRRQKVYLELLTKLDATRTR